MSHSVEYVVRVVCSNGHRERVLDKFGWANLLPDTDHLAQSLPADHPLRSEGLGMMTDSLYRPDRPRIRRHQSFRWVCDRCRHPYQFTYESIVRAVERHAEARDSRLDVATLG